MTARAIRPAMMWAAVYPGQRRLTLAGLYEDKRDAWGDCIASLRYRQGFAAKRVTTRLQCCAAGYRVVRVKVEVVA